MTKDVFSNIIFMLFNIQKSGHSLIEERHYLIWELVIINANCNLIKLANKMFLKCDK